MPHDAVTVLLVSEQAEEIKLITKSLRSFYPGCRVEVVYSSEEAFEWAPKQDWHVIIIDESLFDTRVVEVLQEVRHRAPRSAILIAASRQDSGVALQLVQQGADYSLFKNTPAFLTDLPIVTREILEKRDLRARLDLSQNRYHRLIDNLADMAYELDAEGRFLYVSPAVRGLVHYDPQELIGLHYSTLIPPEDRDSANRRFNERRSESRATRRFKLRLREKDPRLPPVEVEINATALYDRHQHYAGTVGIVKPVLTPPHLTLLQRLSDLPTPLTNILTDTEQLLQTVHDLCDQVGLATTRPGSPDEDSVKASAPDFVEKADPSDAVPPPHLEERRRSPRIDIQMDTHARVNGSSWEGTALNISQGGIYLLLKGDVSANQDQMTRLGFGSEVGVLEIPGVVRHIRRGDTSISDAETVLTGLAIQFSPLEEVKERILHSLIDGLRTQSLSMSVTALLFPPAPPQPSDSASMPLESERSAEATSIQAQERRRAARIALAGPVQIDLPPQIIPGEPSLVNLSTTGACIRLQSSTDLLSRRLSLRFTSPSIPRGVTKSSSEEVEYRLMGMVVWMAPDRVDTSSISSPDSAPIRIGIRFINDPIEEMTLTALVHRYLSVDRTQPDPDRSVVSTEFVQCFNDHGQRLAVCHDHRAPAMPSDAPLVILAPGYGRTKKDYIDLAYYFACNGCHVVRYDHSAHVGESEGGMVQTTLTGMDEDLLAIIEYVIHRWPTNPLILLASDVTGRVVLKHAAHHPSVRLLLLFAPVLDLQYTLMTVHKDDLIAASLRGKHFGISNILGFNIDADAWITDAIQGQYADFTSTRDDLIGIRVPVLVYSSELDPWMRPNLSAQLRSVVVESELEWHESSHAHHGFVDREHAEPVFRQIVSQTFTRLNPLVHIEVCEPLDRDLIRQAHLERERARLHHQMDKSATVEFWRDYLDRSHSLVNFSEYWHLLDHIHRLLGPLDNTMRVLDAGCGNGNFGMFLLIAASFHHDHMGGRQRLNYLGLDLVSNGLIQAKSNLIRVAAELRGKFATSARQSIMNAGLMCVDLNAPLPFHDGQFDRVVCNLVIGYLRDPIFTLRELVRILSPHGKLIVTTFKPQADLSQIYRKFLSLAQNDLEKTQAKATVEAAGTITHGTQESAFRFFEQQELAMLLRSTGASQPRIYSTFANQAYIAVAEKSPSSAE